MPAPSGSLLAICALLGLAAVAIAAPTAGSVPVFRRSCSDEFGYPGAPPDSPLACITNLRGVSLYKRYDPFMGMPCSSSDDCDALTDPPATCGPDRDKASDVTSAMGVASGAVCNPVNGDALTVGMAGSSVQLQMADCLASCEDLSGFPKYAQVVRNGNDYACQCVNECAKVATVVDEVLLYNIPGKCVPA
ncbi:hypothetical protein DFJ74DRAFT_742101 [Hyaloraphidium curvatum]|nr:hypothetical protein DFJ74DRAFT_742101 [Hyaloraphidium curvatum]